MAVEATNALQRLGRQLLTLPDHELKELVTRCSLEELAEIEAAVTSTEFERLVKTDPDLGWRENPATLAHHLTRGEYQLYPYVVLMADKIRQAFDGEDPHLQMWLPSQYGKTTLLGNWTPLWALDRDPRLRIMYISYDAHRAVEEAGKARDLVRDHSHLLRFELRKDKRARGMWSTPQGGGLYAVGMNGGIIGYPADALLLDDLLKGWRDAHSPTTRETAWSIYRSQIRMRIQGNRRPIVGAGTRWHEDDVPARLVKLGRDEPDADQWTIVRLPAIAEDPDPKAEDPIYRMADPLGRQAGEVLEPRRFPKEEVLARQVTAGPYLAAAIEQQHPAPEEGGEIKREWWRYETTLPPGWDDCVSSWDMKLKDKEAGDFVVGLACGRTGKDAWFFDMLRGQWNQATTECAIALMAVRHPEIRRHYIEKSGNGPEVRQALSAPHRDYVLSDDIAGQLGMTDEERAAVQAVRRRGLGRLHEVLVRGSKQVRMRAESGYISGGDVHLWEAPWNAIFVAEHSAFPNGTHDDIVDACSQALSKIMRGVATVKAPRGEVPQTPITREEGGMSVARLARPTGRVITPTRTR